MKPESRVELILWDWLTTKSRYVEEIYFNRKNELNWKTFRIEGNQKKPDFVVKFNRGYGIQYIAIEIKMATTAKSVLDAGKILDYYENYYLNKTRYFIKDKEIKINHFVIATQNSLKGHLFNYEKEILSNSCGKDKWRKTNSKLGLEPLYEYKETSGFQRFLWNQFKRLREKLKIVNAPSLGILHAEIKYNGFTKGLPFLFIMNYNSHLKKKKWGAGWWLI